MILPSYVGKISERVAGRVSSCYGEGPRVPGNKPPIVIGYKEITKNILGFIAIEWDVSTVPDLHYLYCYPVFLMFLFYVFFILV